MEVGGLKRGAREFNIRQKAVVLAICFFSLSYGTAVQAATFQREPTARVWTSASDGYHQSTEFFAYNQLFRGGGSVALGDLGKDGKPEIVTAAGYSGGPQIRIFRLDGSYLNGWFAYDQSMRSGVRVAVGDLDGDKKGEIVTGPQTGGGPQIRVFDSYGRVKGTAGFFAFDSSYHGGVNVAVGDLTNDGKAEIVVGSGRDMAPTVKVFSATGIQLGSDYHPFADDNTGGVSVGVANGKIVMGLQGKGQAWVKVYAFDDAQSVVAQWKAYDDNFSAGINVAASGNNIITSVYGHADPQVRFFSLTGTEIIPNFYAYEQDYQNGVNVAAFGNTILTLPNVLPPDGRTDVERYVKVDLSEQRLYAYDHGYQVNTFLISSGLARTPTPTGEFHIFKKIYDHLYSGPGYYLPHTLYNLEFKQHYYLHGAYWHHNFGHPMSHGCVNIDYPDAAWLYGWMQMGDTVDIQA